MVDEHTKAVEEALALPIKEYKSALAAFAVLDDEKRALSDRLDRVKSKLEQLQEFLLEQYAELGQSSARINGTTIYLHSQVWASAAPDESGKPDKARANEALRAYGLGHMLNESFNTQTLSAWVREHRKEDGTIELPAELAEALKVSTVYSLRTRRSGNGTTKSKEESGTD